MNTSIQQFIDELSNTKPDECALYELVDKYEFEEDLDLIIDPIFNYMERYASEDLGSPGPLVHLVETTYPNFLSNLKASIERKPTGLTVWMLNRILNANIENELREELLTLMKSVLSHQNADEDAKSEASGFLEYQK